MKFLTVLTIFAFFSLFNSISIAETKRDCSQYSTKTIVGTWDKKRCEKGKAPIKKLELVKKIKELNPFKKKN